MRHWNMLCSASQKLQKRRNACCGRISVIGARREKSYMRMWREDKEAGFGMEEEEEEVGEEETEGEQSGKEKEEEEIDGMEEGKRDKKKQGTIGQKVERMKKWEMR